MFLDHHSEPYEDEEEPTRQTISTKVVFLPPFTIHTLLTKEEESERIIRIEKLKWVSLSFFVLGGIFYIVTATWAYILKKNDAFDDESDHAFSIRMFVDSLYGFCYFLNGVVNMWIGAIQSKNSANILNDLDYSSPILVSLSSLSTGSAVPFLSTASYIQLPYPAGRNTKFARSVVIGFFVAIAGLLDSISYFLERHRLIEITVFLISSIVWFLLAVVAVFEVSLCHTWIHNDSSENFARIHFRTAWYLNKIGDVSFFIGASIDIICGIFWYWEDHLRLYSWTIFSAVCWTLDSVLHVLSAIMFEMNQENS